MWARNYSTGPKWIPATVNQPTRPLSYTCNLPDRRRIKRHHDQLLLGAPHGSVIPLAITHEEPSSKDFSEKAGSANDISEKACDMGNASPLRRSSTVRRPVVKLDL